MMIANNEHSRSSSEANRGPSGAFRPESWLGLVVWVFLLAGGMGARAVNLLARNKIEAILGVPAMGLTELADAYLNGKLTSGASACEHHGCGDEHHH